MSKTLKVLIMAGGTGGHIYPAIACSEEFNKQGVETVWLGSKGGMEERLVGDSLDIRLHLLSIKGVRGKGLKGLLLAPFRIVYSIGQALSILRHEKPDAVLGMGGFVAGPGGIAAKLLGIPLIIHEQNALAGTTNRLLSRISNLSLCAFEGALNKGKLVGNPIRSALAQSASKQINMDIARPLRVLVVGGSLGAKAINDVIPDVLNGWDELQRLDVWHQTGGNNYSSVVAQYSSYGIESRVEPYIENMEGAYYWSDLVVCRAGAMTVSELSLLGLPSILVPYPHAIDDHQTVNAKYLEQCQAAILIPQKELTVEKITSLFKEFVNDREQLQKMGENAKKMSFPNATQDVVSQCLGQIKND
ncbi:undecaprenyldiphospho-muramoylpentapeptide beta-N-acetylglucosaminyltransferase [Marinomonas sp. 2405UD68-3]|uniref:undecaprenyldiphospho-muramoylpentapeptide beta-N-acetylglucosaminyltransferase n=1 Tax=Marinomonas sp. 2405UD68-3 TaxID=3391835 RepID=UPI0039C919B5